MGAMIAEALPSSKQTLGLALHAAAGHSLAKTLRERIYRTDTESCDRQIKIL